MSLYLPYGLDISAILKSIADINHAYILQLYQQAIMTVLSILFITQQMSIRENVLTHGMFPISKSKESPYCTRKSATAAAPG